MAEVNEGLQMNEMSKLLSGLKSMGKELKASDLGSIQAAVRLPEAKVGGAGGGAGQHL